jgi:SagB-type dehydrogenase family enzyme
MKALIPPRLFLPAIIVWVFLVSVTDRITDQEANNITLLQENHIQLPKPDLKGSMSLEEAILKRRSERSYKGDPLNLSQVGQLLWSAQGITQSSRNYRAVPSAGATFPLEIYLVAGRVNRLQPGLYKYFPKSHSLIKVKDGDLRDELAEAALSQHMIKNAPASFIIAADYDRTARRYGERTHRYVHIEVGHAGQNLNLQAISLGFGAVMVGAFSDERVKELLGLPSNEDPLYIIPVGKPQ